MASLIAILDLKGKSLIQRSYRDDVAPTYVDRFLTHILEMEDEGVREVPCFSREGVNYLHIRHSNLYGAHPDYPDCSGDPLESLGAPPLLLTPSRLCTVVALSRNNSNAAEILLFLHRLVGVLVEYFKELEEESIRDNFVIIYELLDEMMDFGYPQVTDGKMLRECVCCSASAHRTADPPSLVHQVHNAGVAQTGVDGVGAAGHRCDERRLVAAAGHQVPQKRGVFGCDRECEPPGA